ncbi:MAG: 4Fe-4S binding protein [Lachnospiraceae bacterium]
MEFLTFDAETCTLCGRCVDACPFGALTMEKEGIVVGDGRVCAACVSVSVRYRPSVLNSGPMK